MAVDSLPAEPSGKPLSTLLHSFLGVFGHTHTHHTHTLFSLFMFAFTFYFIYYLKKCFYLFIFGYVTCRISVPRPRTEPESQQ